MTSTSAAYFVSCWRKPVCSWTQPCRRRQQTTTKTGLRRPGSAAGSPSCGGGVSAATGCRGCEPSGPAATSRDQKPLESARYPSIASGLQTNDIATEGIRKYIFVDSTPGWLPLTDHFSFWLSSTLVRSPVEDTENDNIINSKYVENYRLASLASNFLATVTILELCARMVTVTFVRLYGQDDVHEWRL